ncbi:MULTISPECIES: LLM class flavin-dependent oxidoreductase [Actinokineospora]|uniref:Alkanal monooxygenase n=1 Tax=Actinokineospora fastidiosa TaxID=1816 RepID=A0A918GKM2_9PSEU|nr:MULTISPECIES: LLM class flavin-dependent oxidoreductase [Actinokineospora]UVS77615.1 Alkanal monooxygenase alpha chain [Actinokineospora sp. UTMC 2448]GGS42182.1 alkanal monooxygenase [Actinokineospora fastidiosa]
MPLGAFLLAPRFPGQTDRDALDRACAALDAAERAGLDEAWIAEHHFMPYGVCPDAAAFAAYALGRTRRIAVGTAVSVLSTTHPVALAERALLLDNVSGGRFHLGVGRGGPWVDLEVFGTGLERYRSGFPDALDLLLRALTGPTVTGSARFPFREVPVVPAPASLPRPPVAVAATSKDTVALAAARGLPLLLGMHVDDDDKLAMVAHYRAAGGPADAPHVSAVVAHVADSRAEAVAQVMDTAPGWLCAGLAAHVPVDGGRGPSRDPYAYARLLCDLHPVGDLDYCAARLSRSGIGRVIAMVEATGDPGHTQRTVAALGVLRRSGVLPPAASDLGKLA